MAQFSRGEDPKPKQEGVMKTTKIWKILLVSMLLTAPLLSCGGENRSNWECECNVDGSARITSACANSSAEAIAKAELKECTGATTCACSCVDLYIEMGC
jgi:hypothetical protein